MHGTDILVRGKLICSQVGRSSFVSFHRHIELDNGQATRLASYWRRKPTLKESADLQDGSLLLEPAEMCLHLKGH